MTACKIWLSGIGQKYSPYPPRITILSVNLERSPKPRGEIIVVGSEKFAWDTRSCPQWCRLVHGPTRSPALIAGTSRRL